MVDGNRHLFCSDVTTILIPIEFLVEPSERGAKHYILEEIVRRKTVISLKRSCGGTQTVGSVRIDGH